MRLGMGAGSCDDLMSIALSQHEEVWVQTVLWLSLRCALGLDRDPLHSGL